MPSGDPGGGQGDPPVTNVGSRTTATLPPRVGANAQAQAQAVPNPLQDLSHH
jgi:hypothetical protein